MAHSLLFFRLEFESMIAKMLVDAFVFLFIIFVSVKLFSRYEFGARTEWEFRVESANLKKTFNINIFHVIKERMFSRNSSANERILLEYGDWDRKIYSIRFYCDMLGHRSRSQQKVAVDTACDQLTLFCNADRLWNESCPRVVFAPLLPDVAHLKMQSIKTDKNHFIKFDVCTMPTVSVHIYVRVCVYL